MKPVAGFLIVVTVGAATFLTFGDWARAMGAACVTLILLPPSMDPAIAIKEWLSR